MATEVNRGQRPSIWRAIAFLGTPPMRRAIAHLPQLSPQEEMVLIHLTRRVKVMTLQQVREFLPHKCEAGAKRRMMLLSRTGWVVPMRLLSRTIDYRPTSPLVTWSPNQQAPRFLEVVRRSQTRWLSPLHSVLAFSASKRSGLYFGGQARLPRPSEATHDVFLTSVFLHFKNDRLHDADAWVGEGILASEARGKEGAIPDAVIRRADGITAIEVVGESYSATKLSAFHDDCARKGWGYELW